ncbi:hypothetical protein E308F_25990 [Moorella sp. E308F]|uniref:Uncharacterized protein n=1 Tax=Neomoorella glycerini TaxID=55779 RepID=A0A6I5ZXC8_9FIRM|nr:MULTISPECIES: hypothetical protein [Moorella]QGP94117.1 hypothetical protein MGLY_35420 [Moorella glycerini]GEA16353.1 hypothetical protein E308F_25990 [Moorella sp. E308F]
MITKQDVANKLISYLGHRLTLAELVDWAEKVMMEEEFEEGDLPLLRDIVARLGLSDTIAFGLSWEDCRNFLRSLGYDVEVRVTRLASNQ